ncbi:SMI1/KNR4 family protein [Bacillus sp. BGMRC 2118]|nr:SMI1/KNR4 family protein [Bacillus sp. BGMRC 2118]
MVIEEILLGLKKRLVDNKMLVQSSKGYVYEAEFYFNDPATGKLIEEFQKTTPFLLPNDYRNFLSVHNGFTIFKGEFEGQIELYRLEDIQKEYHVFRDAFYHYLVEEKQDSYPIGYYTDIGMLMINNEKVKQGLSDYLWITSIDDIDLNTSFEVWLDRAIMSQGNHYWSWGRSSDCC